MKWEYKVGYLTVSGSELNKQLNTWGDDSWELISLIKVTSTNELSPEGHKRYVYEVVMKRQK